MGRVKSIVYFLDFVNVVGGSNKVLLTQAYIMKQRGYRVRMVHPGQEGRHPLEELDEICRKYGLETAEAGYTVATCLENIDILKALDDYSGIVKLLETYRPDLIHSAQLNIAVEFAARDLGIPHLMNIYQADKEAFYLQWMNVYPQYHSADSRLFSERWKKGLGIPSRCIRVAYEKNAGGGKSIGRTDRITIISIGVFCEHKNQLEILKFILGCKNAGKNVKIVFLGSNNNDYGKRCNEFVDNYELWEYVEFKGFVLNVEDYLNDADLFLLASTVESYPGVIVESMANKVPVISTPVAGVPELLLNETNGFLTKGYEAEDIKDAFMIYLDFREKGQIKQIVENAYKTYLENHTYAVVGKQLGDYYGWIVEDYNKKNVSHLTADLVRQRFQKIFENRNLDVLSPETKNIIWFLLHVFSEIEHKGNKRVAIWGAGLWGGRVLEWFRMWNGKAEFVGFMDSEKQGNYLGYPILDKKEDVIKTCGTIFIAIRDTEAVLGIMNTLERYGKVRNKDYFLTCNSPIRI